MKRILSLAAALALCLGLYVPASAAGGTAYASTQSVEVDGESVQFQMYALKDASGNGTNYVKLRDVAHVLNGTPAQFAVGYDGSIAITTGQPYADTGTEMTTPYSGDRAYQTGSGAVLVDGKAVTLDAIVLTDDNGGGYTYFKLRDLGSALGFTVDWSAQHGVTVSTGTTQPEQPQPTPKPAGAVGGHYDVTAYDVPADTNKDGWITESEVQVVLDQLRDEYPDGSEWGRHTNYYGRPDGKGMGGGTACQGYAYMVSDRIFGTLPYYTVALDETRVGDIMINKQANHDNIVLNDYGKDMFEGVVYPESYTTTDGNVSGIVVWDKVLFYADWPAGVGNTRILSRYPQE